MACDFCLLFDFERGSSASLSNSEGSFHNRFSERQWSESPSFATPRLDRIGGLETSTAYAQSGRVLPLKYPKPLSGEALITLVQAKPYDLGSLDSSDRRLISKYDRRIPEMKNKVICGRKPTIGVEKTKTRIKSVHGNRGVIASPTGRRSSLLLIALQLVARKIRARQ